MNIVTVLLVIAGAALLFAAPPWSWILSGLCFWAAYLSWKEEN